MRRMGEIAHTPGLPCRRPAVGKHHSSGLGTAEPHCSPGAARQPGGSGSPTRTPRYIIVRMLIWSCGDSFRLAALSVLISHKEHPTKHRGPSTLALRSVSRLSVLDSSSRPTLPSNASRQGGDQQWSQAKKGEELRTFPTVASDEPSGIGSGHVWCVHTEIMQQWKRHLVLDLLLSDGPAGGLRGWRGAGGHRGGRAAGRLGRGGRAGG